MLLDDAHHELGWPARGDVLNPPGAGSRTYADFARAKIEAELRRQHPGVTVATGILASDPQDDATTAPLAVVCEFPHGASDSALATAHRLAWNFSRTTLLVTLEPGRLVAWSCCVSPAEPASARAVCTLTSGAGGQDAARLLLHRVSLATGMLHREKPTKFRTEGRADATLLANLKAIRAQLLAAGMSEAVCHDLLARVIFTQFLFHRRDGKGRAFFDDKLLASRCGGALQRVHGDLASILRDKEETYALFEWLDERFNGDMFPGKEDRSPAARAKAWRTEKAQVTVAHLTLLADLVSGRWVAATGQGALWSMYSFDVIPLEFISSVYEEFLRKDQASHKAYYTPSYLVDYALDAVLPWASNEWDVKILDPSCGSGIFLVKAFQRLIHRWRRAHPGVAPRVTDLRRILQKNLTGVDRHGEAVRVACFSLYLALADAIEPRHCLKRRGVFPRLRGVRLHHRDFFDESPDVVATPEADGVYDLVLGNAPWGDGSALETSDEVGGAGDIPQGNAATLAMAWAAQHGWPVVNFDLGPLFLAKSAALLRAGGTVAMVQSASLFTLRSDEGHTLRRHLFERFAWDEVTNFTILRYGLYDAAKGPSALVVFRRASPEPGEPLLYICPKPLHDPQAQERFVVDPTDVHEVTHEEAAHDPAVWTALLLGGRRDLDLLRRLARLPTLASLQRDGRVQTRDGVIPGDRKCVLDGRVVSKTRHGKKVPETLPDMREERYFHGADFPEDFTVYLDRTSVPKWHDPRIDARQSYNFDAFRMPQLLVRRSLHRAEGRMRALRVRGDASPWGVICQKTCMTVHDPGGDAALLDAAWVVFNSAAATWFLAMTSERLAYGRQEALKKQLMEVPVPQPVAPVDLPSLSSFVDVDACAATLYGLSEADRILVEDCVLLTLPDTQRSKGPGHTATVRGGEPAEVNDPGVFAYARCLVRVMESSVGRRKPVGAAVFEEPGPTRLPARMVALYLDDPAHVGVVRESMTAAGLVGTLRRFSASAMQAPGSSSLRRTAFLFDQRAGETGIHVYIVKPDQRRYWMRSTALADGDRLSGALLEAAARARGKTS